MNKTIRRPTSKSGVILSGLHLAFLTLCMVAGPWAETDASSDPGHRVALVVGNSAYAHVSPLRNPANDARAMSDALRQLGFDVISVENADKKALELAILDFAGKLRRESTGLFYYAGHGMQARGRNFLIPVDARLPSESSLRVAGVDVSLVLEEMGLAGNRVNIVILDACRNNPFEGKFRGTGQGLAAIDAARGTLVAYSTAPGSVAADGDGANSLYTSQLLEALREPGLKVEEVFKRVRVRVSDRTAANQVPWESSSLTGDFIFNLNLRVTPPASASRELVFWQSVQHSTDPSELQAYLDAYPSGTFAPLAKARMRRLRSAGGNAGAANQAPPPRPPARTTQGPSHRQPPRPNTSAQTIAKARPAPRVAPATGQYRVALMPIAMASQVFYSESPLGDEVGATLDKLGKVELVHSFYRDRDFYDVVDVDTYWNPGHLHRTPNLDQVLALAERRQLDGVVMVWYEPIGTFIDPDGDVPTNPIEVFLVDRHTREVRSLKGIYRHAEALTEKLLSAKRH